MRYALKVQYIGKNYAGSQIQFGGKSKENPQGVEIEPTIQGELEKAISTLINSKRCGAGAGLREQAGQGETLRSTVASVAKA
jgi:tRNA U38,U39,U40 pseudouridine synthase TruA